MGGGGIRGALQTSSYSRTLRILLCAESDGYRRACPMSSMYLEVSPTFDLIVYHCLVRYMEAISILLIKFRHVPLGYSQRRLT